MALNKPSKSVLMYCVSTCVCKSMHTPGEICVGEKTMAMQGDGPVKLLSRIVANGHTAVRGGERDDQDLAGL